MVNEIALLFTGLVLGFTATLSPGPLITLVISETLKYDVKEGIKVALAPLITDGPIVLFILFILNKLANFDFVVGTISIFGSLYLLYLAYHNIFIKETKLEIKGIKPHSIKKAVITNFLSPYPYLFWILVGGPIFIKGLEASLLSSILFVVALYVAVVGTLITVAFVVQKLSNFLKSRIYIYIVKFLGLVLLVFAFIFMKEGLNRIGII